MLPKRSKLRAAPDSAKHASRKPFSTAGKPVGISPKVLVDLTQPQKLAIQLAVGGKGGARALLKKKIGAPHLRAAGFAPYDLMKFYRLTPAGLEQLGFYSSEISSALRRIKQEKQFKPQKKN